MARNLEQNVHIVVAKRDNWILDRYATILSRELGWTVGKRSRPSAAMNYFLPYLEIRRSLPDTKTGAWFTHLEEKEDGPGKSKIRRWYWAAEHVDLRCVQAKKYLDMLIGYGPTVQIPTPVDTKKFVPRKVRVGVAGRVYKPSRKGEKLVAQLVALDEFEVVGAGEGWPCPTTFYAWDEMQEFYQGLDIFLITSEVEGGPDTVLEALACGTPVVGPKGVGMLDEFQILRYPRNSFDGMVRCLRQLASPRYVRWGQVEKRTEEQFAKAYLRAVQGVL